MKTTLKMTVLAILMAALCTAPLYAAPAAKKGKKAVATWSAKVVDASGRPVQGAVVTAMEGTQVTRTSENGEFSVRTGAADYICIEHPAFETRNVFLPNLASDRVIVLDSTLFQLGQNARVNVPFGELEQLRIVNGVERIRPSDLDGKFNDRLWKSLVEAEGLGTFGSNDIRGEKYVVVVDGLVRDGGSSFTAYSDKINVDEIEEITILKDAASRLLYGTLADAGIIMITTRHGQSLKRDIHIRYESDFGIPKSYPGYLHTADYMIKYNEALENDGLSKKYSYEDIEAARSGSDPVMYPEIDYYSSEFLRSFKPQHRVSADCAGGNDVTRYYVNLGWYNTSSILKGGQADNQRTNCFNMRGNVDVKLNEFISINLAASSIFNAYSGVNYKNLNFWKMASQNRINAQPLLIPIDRINPEYQYLVDDARSQRSVLFGNSLLGGDMTFTQNIYGDLYLGGYSNSMDRMAEINAGIDVNLESLVEGLKFKTYFGSDNYNRYTVTQANSYAVYTPTLLDDGTYAISQVGVNDFVGAQKISDVAFFRRTGWYNVLSYDQIFGGVHDIKAVANSILGTYKESGSMYTERSLNYGARVNYMYDRKFIAEYGAALVGSQKLSRGHRWGYAQSLGAGWIVCDDPYFLKIKASLADSRTDISSEFDSFHLYQNTYLKNGTYSYADGAGSNNLLSITAGNASLGWIHKHDISLGAEAYLFDKTLAIEAALFHTKRKGEPVRLSTTSPFYVGGDSFLPYVNYGSHKTDGAELRIGWTHSYGDWHFALRADVKFYKGAVLAFDELDYGEGMEYYRRRGSSTDAIWGLVATGLYTQEEIDGMDVIPSYGTVKAGDIKYADLNGDKVIDAYDMKEIGHSHARFNYGLNVDISWKRFNLWAYLFAQTGGSTLFNGDYYNVYGEKKYSVNVLSEGYPRLTTMGNANNNVKSSYWIGSTNHFAIPDIQLTYNVPGDHLKIYLKAQDCLMLGPNADKLQLNVGSEPKYRTVCVGATYNF
ncbi:MAG: hypothetical protein KBS55_00840 [Bacteroidales bacterium]|nr:hypothetical protein [Candidatus Cryptobacteroides aphodequi]